MEKNIFFSVFLVSLLFLILSYFSLTEYYAQNTFQVAAAAAALFILLGVAVFHFFGRGAVGAFAISALLCAAIFHIDYASTVYLHSCLLFFAVSSLWKSRSALVEGCGSLKTRVALGFIIFLALICAAVIAGGIVHLAGFSDNEKVSGIISSLPLYIVIMSFTIGPISEELFFRAMLVPRVGVPLSSILFMCTHAAYGSISEFAGAFALGFVLANAYFYTRDPLPCIIAHALFNLCSIALIFWVF